MVELDRAVSSPITDPELEGFIPSLTMRPHHFFRSLCVQDALRRRGNSREIKLVKGRVKWTNPFTPKNSRFFPFPVDQRTYFKDVVGKTDADRERFHVATEDYLTRLWKLSDESFIQLDLQPDGICKAAHEGKHCVAFYVRREKIDIFIGENINIRNIEFKLKEAGYKLGKDYIERETSNIIYDYDHRSLNTRKPATPVTVVFNSLIVRTGALRRI